MTLWDTDHFSVLADARHSRHAHLTSRLESSGEPTVLPIVSVEEQLRGWLAQVRRISDVRQQISPYDRLLRLLDTFAEWDVARFGEPAADEFIRLRKQRIRIGTQDLKIASIAIANDALLLSANLRDFEKVPGLRVEDWIYA
jgi:tRNA(fMet)-specific endonuclease VapC